MKTQALLICLVLVAFLLASPDVMAQEVDVPPQALPSFGGLLLQVMLSLALVSALAYGALRFGLARVLRPSSEEGSALEVMQSMPLGPRQRVWLVRARDRVLLIGSSEAGLQTLADFGVDSGVGESFEEALERTKKPCDESQGSVQASEED